MHSLHLPLHLRLALYELLGLVPCLACAQILQQCFIFPKIRHQPLSEPHFSPGNEKVVYILGKGVIVPCPQIEELLKLFCEPLACLAPQAEGASNVT